MFALVAVLHAISFPSRLQAAGAPIEAPYVDAKAINARFDEITAEHMDLLR